MSVLPATVAQQLDRWIGDHLAPAWLEVERDGNLLRAEGALHRYELADLAPGTAVADRLHVLEGLIPGGPEPDTVECVMVAPDIYADILVFGDGATTWVLLVDATALARHRQELRQRGHELALARDELDRLIHSMMPETIARRLRVEKTIADSVRQASILFADIHDFSGLTAELSATDVVGLLNRVFSEFDELAEGHGLIRVKTSGDTYECVAGAPEPRSDHAQAAAELALDMQKAIPRFPTSSGRAPSLRIGIHSGPLIAGVIGTRRRAYDVWGDSVRIASHMEIYGLPGRIQVTAATYELLRADYLLEKRGEFYVAGQGDVVTYLLHGRRVQKS